MSDDIKSAGGANNRPEDSYDLLHKNFSLFGMDEEDDIPPADEDVKNSGEIYFSANSDASGAYGGSTGFSEDDFLRFSLLFHIFVLSLRCNSASNFAIYIIT